MQGPPGACGARASRPRRASRIPKRKTRTLKLKFSKGEVKKLRKAKKKQMKGSGDDQGDRVERRPPRP